MNRENDGQESLGHYEPTPRVQDNEPIDFGNLVKGFIVSCIGWLVAGALVFGFFYFVGTRF